MAWLGDLLVRLRAETADFQQDMGKAAQSAERSMQQIQRAAAALGATISVGALALFVRSSIDAAARLHELSETTAITVDDLAGLAVAAKQSGGDLESIAASISKMSVEMGKHGAKFAALGVTAKEPLAAFKQLADVFKGVEDPELRAAVAATALGKSWQGAAPLLAQGGKRIGEMVDQGRKLSGMTKDMADRADEFNASMVELNVILDSTSKKLIGDALPSLNEISRAMREAAMEGGLALTAWVALGGAMAYVLGLTDAQKTATRIREINEQLALVNKQIESGSLNPKGASTSFWSFLIPDVKLKDEAIAKLRETVAALEAEKARLMPPRPKAAPGTDPADKAAADARARAFVADQAALQKRQVSALQQMEEKKRSLFNLNEQDLTLLRITQGTYKDFDADTQVRLLNMAAEIDERAELIKRVEEGIPALQAESDAMERGGEILRDYNQQNVAANDDMHFQTSLLGKSAAEQERLSALRQIDLDLLRRSRDLANAYGDDQIGLAAAQAQLEKQAANQRAAALAGIAERRQAERDWATGSKKAFDDYAEAATNAAANAQLVFGNLFRNMEDALVQFVKTGKLDFKSLADSIISDLIRIQIRAQITGPLAQQAGAGFPALFGGGNNPGGPTGAEGMTGGTFAAGGRPPVGAVSLVGEMGPELFVPDVAGTIVQNSEIGGMSSGNTYYINASNADAAGLARLQRMLLGMNASFDARSVAASKKSYAKRGRRSGMA